MIDRELQAFLRQGDPANGRAKSRLDSLQEKIMRQVEHTPQDIGMPFAPARRLRVPFGALVRGFALGIVLCSAGVWTGRMTSTTETVAASTFAEPNAEMVLAMASPWGDWIGE